MPSQDRLLRFRPLSVVDVPFQVLENAYWRPQAAKLHGRHKETLAAVSDTRAKQIYEKLQVAWRLEETWINHALNALLLALPADGLGKLLGDIWGGHPVAAPGVAKIDSAGIASITGDPDFVVVGSEICVLGESKVAAQPTSHRYGFQQFTKYQLLGSMVSCARDPAFRREPKHVVVVPDLDPSHFCDDHDQWRPRLEGSRLVFDPAGLDVRDRRSRYRDYKSWRAFLRETLLDKRVMKRCELEPDMVDQLFAEGTVVPIPTYVVRWSELMSSVRSSSAKASGLSRAATTLEELAYGPNGDPLDRFVATKVTFL